MTTKRVVIVIPAFNEERTTVEVIRGLKQRGFTKLIIVDDGSNDRTGELASSEGVIRLRHLLNRGSGARWGPGSAPPCVSEWNFLSFSRVGMLDTLLTFWIMVALVLAWEAERRPW
jgi:hypothetical protein